MPFSILRDDATLILLRRAFTMWILVRLVVEAARTFAVMPDGSIPEPSVPGIVLLATFLNLAEWHRRRERAFWRNLGLAFSTMCVIAVSAACAGELLVASITSVIPHR